MASLEAVGRRFIIIPCPHFIAANYYSVPFNEQEIALPLGYVSLHNSTLRKVAANKGVDNFY